MAFIRISNEKFIELNGFKLWEKNSDFLTVFKFNIQFENLLNKDKYFQCNAQWVLFGLTIIDLILFDTRLSDQYLDEIEPIMIGSDAFREKEEITTSVIEWYIIELSNRNEYTELKENENRIISWSFPTLSNPIWTKAFVEYKDSKGNKTIKEM